MLDGVAGQSRRAKGIDVAAAAVSEVENLLNNFSARAHCSTLCTARRRDVTRPTALITLVCCCCCCCCYIIVVVIIIIVHGCAILQQW